MRRVLIISYTNLDSDPRILRQIEFFGRKYEIFSAGLRPSLHKYEKHFIELPQVWVGDQPFEIKFHIKFPLLFRKIISVAVRIIYFLLASPRIIKEAVIKGTPRGFEYKYWNILKIEAVKKLSEFDYDLIIANDLSALPLAVRVKEKMNAKLYFDAHEYAPLEYDNDPVWLRRESPYLTYLVTKYISATDYRSTIGNMIANKFLELTGLEFAVVYNAPVKYSLQPSSADDNIIRCVHHGIAAPIRGIENMIDAFDQLNRNFELHLYLMNNDAQYYSFLKHKIASTKNIFLHDPVPTRDLPIVINQYDLMVNFIPPVNFNYTCGLPNKFFESIQARLMIVCGPSEEQGYLIKKYNLGFVGKGFESKDIVDVLANLDKKDISTFKQNANQVANIFCAEIIMTQLTEDIEKKLFNQQE